MSCDKYAHFMVSSATVIVLAILNYKQSLEGFTQGILIILDVQLALKALINYQVVWVVALL